MEERDRTDLVNKLLDVMPIPVFITDGDVRLRFFNRAAGRLLGPEYRETDDRSARLGEALACGNSIEKGCGMSGFCGDCVIRNSTYEAIGDTAVRRRKTRMKCVNSEGDLRIADFLVTTGPIEFKGEKLALVVLEDISDLIQLERLLPICAKCKKIRND
ncbi:MAG: PAS domain-containing protein, partial [Candidatus Omnitrophica bacterium]|nr:PAS domain-containing protein [Candidatus Omnitrophota bacterium]